MLPYVLSFLGGYLVGSFPTGYLLAKQRSNVDITHAGSGNVGAYNVAIVTGSKRIGILVGVLDGLKGLIAIGLSYMLAPDFWVLSVGFLASVLGHNYPVWLGFKGGRGLATGCGGLLVLGPAYILVWCSLWFILKWQRQTILGANLIAILATPVILLLLPGRSIEATMALGGSAGDYRWLGLFLSFVFLLKHLDAFGEVTARKE